MVGDSSDQQVEVAVVVVVGHGRAAPDIGREESRTQVGRDVGEALAVLVLQ